MSVDILMATYDGEEYLAEQLDSLLAQSFQDWRLLVSDDCSTDATLDILHDYEKKDSRIMVVSEGTKYGGAKENFWSLMPYAESPFIMFCDQDDVWHENKIERTLDEMHKMEEKHGRDVPLLVFTDLSITDADLNIEARSFMRHENYFSLKPVYEKLVLGNMAPGCTMLFNKALADKALVGGSLDFIDMHDWWLILVASATGYIHYIDEPTIDYRQHAGNAVGIWKRTGFKPPNTSNASKKAILSRWRTAVILDNMGASVHEKYYTRMVDFRNSSCGGLRGLILLAKSGFWDETPRRRLGQVYTTLFKLNKEVYEEFVLGHEKG